MNVEIKGYLKNCHNSWSLSIGLLEHPLLMARPLQCLKELEKHIRAELDDEKLECFFKIDDTGVFYLVLMQTPQVIEYLATRMINLDDLAFDPNQLKEEV